MGVGEVKFSVVVCTFNGEEFVEAQLNSILRQSVMVSEVVISDDNSTDRTWQILETWSERQTSSYPAIKIKLFRNSRSLGVARNFEAALREATHDWIFLCDQDDVWLERKVESFKNRLAENSAPRVFNSDGFIVDENLNSLGYNLFDSIRLSKSEKRRILAGNSLEVLLQRNICTGASMLIHQQVFDSSTPFPSGWLHDEWLAICASIMFDVDVIDEPTFYYRQHQSNVVGAKKITFRQLVRQCREPRSERISNLYRRAGKLLEFWENNSTGTRPKDTAVNALLMRNLHFNLQRLNLPANRFLRILPIISMLVSGEYKSFGRGFFDALRDSLQPGAVDMSETE